MRYKDNVMVSINWVVAFIEALFLGGLIGGKSLWIQIASLMLMVILGGVYFAIYIYWMRHDPNRLQSEGYNLELASSGLSDDKDPKISTDDKKVPVDVPDPINISKVLK